MNILENPIEIVADPDLQNIKVQAQKQRHGYYKVRFHNLVIHCCDLLSFYMAGKDIFLHQIYNINTSNPAPRIIDGGGHIGLFTLYAKVRFPQSKVIVFEPEALSLELLRRNIADNGLQGVTIVESGLHDRDGQISFSADGSDGSSLSHGGDGETTIQITKLSPYLNEQIDFLKLNIEGSELEVIREVEQHLDRVQELVIEYHGFPSLGQRLHLILEVLDRSGFRYMVHDFDAETNSASKPPFFIDTERQFFHLIYGRKLFERKTVTSSVGDELSRAEPVCRKFGFSRGKPIDRFYIESFLKGHGKEIRGHVLEVAESTYTRQFGIDVSKSDVLHAHPEPEATIIADLCEAESLPHEQFDCIILTQTLQFLYDYREALRNITQALKPGGTLLLTGSGISQISRFDMDRWGEYWRFTDKSLHDLLLEYCPECDVHVETYGNVAAAKAFLDGRASEELSEETLRYHDKDYQILLTATVTKAQREQTSPSSLRSAIEKSSAPIPHLLEPRVLLYHRVIDDPIDSQLLAVSPKNFEAQLEILNKHYRVLGLEELVEEMRSGIYKENTIALSFDDGYFDNAQYALPLLEQYNVPATFFLTTSFIGSHKELYWDALERLLLIEKPPIEVLALDTNNGPFELDLKTSKARFESYEILCDTLKQLDAQKRDEFLQQLYQLTGLEYSARHSHRAMSWEEVSILHASPVAEIGVHTVHHTCLASLSEEDQRRELAEAKRILEHELSTEMSLCSYPWGSASDFTMATMRIAREVGFQAGIANIQSACKQPVDLYQVPRLLVRNYDGQEFLRWLDSTQGQAMEQAQIAKRSERLGNLHNEANHSAY